MNRKIIEDFSETISEQKKKEVEFDIVLNVISFCRVLFQQWHLKL